MFFKQKHKLTFEYLGKNLLTAAGLILIWRGIWYVLDGIDKLLFNGSHGWTGVLGIVVGLLILYIPDRNLNSIERL